MKTIPTLLFQLLLLCTGVWAQPTDLHIEGLKGKVKRIDERNAEIVMKKGVPVEERLGFEKSKVFDEKGRLTFESFVGTSITERRFSYEKNGVRKAVSEIRLPFEKAGAKKLPSVSASVFKHNEKENSLTELRYVAPRQTGPVLEINSASNHFKYFFDSSNRLLKKVFFSSEGRELNVDEYYYREADHPSDVVILYRGNAIQFLKYTYELDSHGNWTKRIEYSKPVNPQQPERTTVTYRKISSYEG